MGLFSRANSVKGERETHSPLSVLPWGEVRRLDSRMSRRACRAGKQLVTAASLSVHDLSRVLDNPSVDGHLRTLIPALTPLGGFPTDPDEVAYDFATGWLVADAEERLGLARPGMISGPAQMALWIVRPDPDSAGFAPASWQFLDLGYCANRLALEPGVVLRRCVWLMLRIA